jgi:PPOX class probable F420-dependent enzyme
MQRMTDSEWRQFIIERPRPAIAAVVREDGRPHATPIWIDMDGEQIVTTSWHDSVKVKALRRDPRMTVVVQDESPPFSYVMISGTVTLSDDMDELRYWAGRLGGRYMGADRAEEFAKRNAVPGEFVVRMTIEQVSAFKNITE